MRLLVEIAKAAALVTAIAAEQASAQTTFPETPPPSQVQDGSADDVSYQRKVAEAVMEYDSRNWAEARALFLQAHELMPSARTLRTLGMTAFELRDYVTALRELTAALEDGRRALDDRLRAEVQALVERTRAFVGRFRVKILPGDAQLLVDDQPAMFETDGTLLLGLGEHTLRATAPGHVPRERTLAVSGREDGAIDLTLETALPAALTASGPAATSTSLSSRMVHADTADGRLFTWIAASGAVAVGGAAVGLKLASDNEFDDLEQECNAMPGGKCERGEVDDSTLDTLETFNTIAAITAGTLAVSAVVLYFVEGSAAESSGGLAIGPAPRLAYRF